MFPIGLKIPCQQRQKEERRHENFSLAIGSIFEWSRKIKHRMID